MKRGQVQTLCVLKACQNYMANTSQLKTRAPTTLVGPPELKSLSPPLQPQLVPKPAFSLSHGTKIPCSYGNPCLDLYFLVLPGTPDSGSYLKQLLPLAWSHNSLTTLKLICKLLGRNCDLEELFYTAALWLHQNHPKTLAHNLLPIAGSLGRFRSLLEVLYGVLEGRDDANYKRKRIKRMQDLLDYYDNLIIKTVGSGRRTNSKKREKIIAMAKKAIEMYKGDQDYQFLHERVSDIYAECLKYDIKSLKKFEQQEKDNVNDPKHSLKLGLTDAATWCPSVDSFFDRATLLCESIAKKVFPREQCSQGSCAEEEEEEEEEADYTSRVRERLMKEVLEPLRKAMDEGFADMFPRKQHSCPIEKYLNDVKASGESTINVSAILPHDIIGYVSDKNFGQLVEHQWKAMVEKIYLKQGKFKNCLAVCDISARMSGYPMDMSISLGLLVSELGEEPWKGKVITFSRNPQLHSIQGSDLKSKYTFMRTMDNQHWDATKTLMMPSFNSWETDYEAIQRKFKEKGYGDVVPRILFWNLNDNDMPIPVAHATEQGVARLSGFSYNLVKCFLENDGEIGPHHLMEIDISCSRYQRLAVVD
ncbi:hypothetical protein L3X38_029358 [Prunus dulcis]|uniref:Uncharacterized protein n=1 Tax=Prunus dulcis TaxID=3755 RepID=A0AAD4Z242_PRUDU|nr:hypothetical protein L3X38_029358 [Prunus dulcis]